MKPLLLIIVGIAVFAAPAGAEQLPSFQASLAGIGTAFRTTRAKQLEVKNENTARDLDLLARDLRNHGWDAGRMRNDLSSLRRRAENMNRQSPRPGEPRRGDAFFRSDLQRFVWNLRDLNRNLERAKMTLDRLAREARKDPEIARAAAEVDRQARALAADLNWLDSDGRWAGSDFRRAGFSMEGWDVERGTRDAYSTARDLERDTRQLLGRVQ